MGYTFFNITKSELIEQVCKGDHSTCGNAKWIVERKALRGNHLWLIMRFEVKADSPKPINGVEPGQSVRYISLALLAKSEGAWGYKRIDEFMGPSYHTVPLSWLDEVPVLEEWDESGWAKGWREKARQEAQRKNVGRKFEVGATYRLQGVASSFEGKAVTITSLRPFKGTIDGQTYRISRKQIGEEVKVTETV